MTTDADDDRQALERSRYLRRTADMELNERQARALAFREMGYAPDAIAREIGVAHGTVTGWLARVAARYGLEAIETRLPAEHRELELMTVERLEGYSTARGGSGRSVRDDFRNMAVANPDVVPADVLEELVGKGEDGSKNENGGERSP